MQHLNPVFIPGPTNIPDALRHAMNVQTTDNRAPGFADTLQPLLADLKKVFKTAGGRVFVFPGSGTGGWEASITNTLSPGDKVLVARYGMFSHRWIDLCQRHGLDVEIIECEWGTGAPAERIAEGVRRAVDAWGLRLCAKSPDLYSDTVSAIYVPEGFDSEALTNHAYTAYGVSFGVGLGEMAGRAFRIGHLGALTDVLALSGLATIEMAMKDLGYPVELGSGVAAAQQYYRQSHSCNQRSVLRGSEQ